MLCEIEKKTGAHETNGGSLMSMSTCVFCNGNILDLNEWQFT